MEPRIQPVQEVWIQEQVIAMCYQSQGVLQL